MPRPVISNCWSMRSNRSFVARPVISNRWSMRSNRSFMLSLIQASPAMSTVRMATTAAMSSFVLRSIFVSP